MRVLDGWVVGLWQSDLDGGGWWMGVGNRTLCFGWMVLETGLYASAACVEMK